ncbi:PQQ-binding-like beta-propeller repeat protein [Streptomyces natalensis]|uniref:outer membrane protein assembly factor BamB family protein n=1 Tax=Streptomyces natalensis TaxID=68242 RepID=UPI00068B4B2E|nr:PQQ-binding-like beta-propeller repeat protein [Streptomyces natalensis]
MVVLIGAGVGGYFLLSGDDSDGKAPPANAMQQLWKAPSPMSDREGQDENGLRSMWFNDDDVIYGDGAGVRAYNLKSGKKEWTVKTPEGAGEVCAMSKEPSDDGVGAVIFDAGGNDCAYLSVIDTDTGHTLWSKDLKDSWHEEDSPEVVVNSKVVEVSIGRNTAAYSLNHGVKLWHLVARGGGCLYSTALSPQYLAAVSECTAAKPKHQMTLQDLEYDSIHSEIPGEKRSIDEILSDDPLTVLMHTDNNGAPNPDRFLQTFTDEGKPDHSFKLEGELKKLKFGPRTSYVDTDNQVLVSEYGDYHGIAAMDLKTGKLLWKKFGSEAIAGVDREGVIVVTDSLGGADAVHQKVMAIGLRDGKEKELGSLYDPKHALPSPDQMSLSWYGGENTLLIQSTSLSNDGQSVQALKAPMH